MADKTNNVLESEAAKHYTLAREYMASRASGSLLSAIAEFEKVVAIDPDYSDARERLEYALEEKKGILEYIYDFEQILATNPDDIPTRYDLAYYFRTLGRDEEAIHHWRIVGRMEYPDWSKSARKMLRKHYQIIES